MGKTDKKSKIGKISPPRQQLRVVVDRTITDTHQTSAESSQRRIRELRVILNRADAIPPEQIESRLPQRRREPHSSAYLRELRRGVAISQRFSGYSQSQRNERVSAVRSIERKRRDLIVRIRPEEIENVVNASRRRVATPVYSTSQAVGTPESLPAAPEMITPPVRTPAPPRRRHAAIPRRVTYHRGLDISAEELEALCDNPYSIGTFTEICGRCGAIFFEKEPKNGAGVRLLCCKNGIVSIPIPSCPPELELLFTEDSERTIELLANIRAANSFFAMASFKTSAPNRQRPVQDQGHLCFSVCGQVYHYATGVPTSQGLPEPVPSHYYFLDASEVMNRRNNFFECRIPMDTLKLLKRSLRRRNKYMRAFKCMGEVLREEAGRRDRRVVDDVIIAFSPTTNLNEHRRWFYFIESHSEIAGVFYGTEPPVSVDLKLYLRPGAADDVDPDLHSQELKNFHPMCDPMVYPLLFPYAEDGYAVNTSNGFHKITMHEFYRFRIMSREMFSLLHNGGKLFQQYLIDAWVRVEVDVLHQHRERFRFAFNEAIRNAIAMNPENANRVGRAVVLPSEFAGGPRYMQRLYLDAMAIVARHGKPDLFITFTCNPHWPEIECNLEYLQTPENRPDLVCRVFHTKLLEFMDDLVNKQIWGIVQNYHYVVEFKKRGLPQARIVVTFVPEDRILTAEQVDGIITARIPDRNTQPRLYELVRRYQVHRPCGDLNPRAPCMDETRCKQFFPKEYSEKTVLRGERDHRPLYKRPRDNRCCKYSIYTITNTCIVPHNSYALAKFQCHINFEVVGSLQTLNYLYKYVTKGQDCITVYEEWNGAGVPRSEIDKVRNYLDCRYVGSMEATWRLLKFKLHDRSHSILVLPVHLPGAHSVMFDENDGLEELQNQLAKRSKLEAWFALNTENADARQYRYIEVPEHFVWENQTMSWRVRRQISKMIGCVAEVTPRQGNMELFYLRVLLRHVAGATSFEALRTVDGVVRETFEAACVALHLLSYTHEYDLCLREAARMRSPRQMRRLFGLIVTMLSDETVTQVPLLWRNYRDIMIEDFLRRRMGRRDSLLACVEEIEAALRRNGSDWQCVALGIVVEDEVEDVDDARLVREERMIEDEDEPLHLRQYTPKSLNSEQKRIFFRIVQSVARINRKTLPEDLFETLGDDISADNVVTFPPGEHLFFVDGPGGTGKTFLYNTVIRYVWNILNIPVVAVAWTGIGANLLIRGKTVHRLFRLPLALNETTTVGWHSESEESAFLKRAGLLLWDEAPMIHRYAVEAVDRYLRDITGAKGLVMGGKCCVLGGDFRQILPVIPLGHRASIIDASLKRFLFWNRFVVLKLTVNVRVARQAANDDARVCNFRELGERSYEEWLLALGEGRLPYVTIEGLWSAPADLIEVPSLFYSRNLEDLISFVYSDGLMGEDIGERAILSPTNAMIESVNDMILELLPGNSYTFVSIDEVKYEPEDDLQIPQDVLNSVNVAGLPPHKLTLKVGAVVMLLQNLDIENGECKGTRMRVTRLGEHLIECQLLMGENKGRTVWLPKIKMIARDTMIPQEVIRTQFPVCVAYALTINKSLGHTLKRVGVFLKQPCFSHGQLYGAFSRVGSPGNIRIFVEDGLKQGSFRHTEGKKFTRNIVFHMLLSEEIPLSSVGDHRILIQREYVAKQAELEETFRDDKDNEFFENIDVSQIGVNLTEEQAPIVDASESFDDPYVDDAGIDVPYEFAPRRTQEQLIARISTHYHPGTSGVGLARTSPYFSTSRRYHQSQTD